MRPTSRASPRSWPSPPWSTSEARPDALFTTHILVRFGDLDPAGIAYYPNLVNYLHVAFEDFFSGYVKRPYPDLIKRGLGFPTVKVEMEYDSPVRFGDRVEVGIVFERVGRSSAHIRYEGRVEGRLVFRARNVAVCVDMTTFRPVPIPDDLRASFESAKA